MAILNYPSSKKWISQPNEKKYNLIYLHLFCDKMIKINEIDKKDFN